jgi:hypothetical protein
MREKNDFFTTFLFYSLNRESLTCHSFKIKMGGEWYQNGTRMGGEWYEQGNAHLVSLSL